MHILWKGVLWKMLHFLVGFSCNDPWPVWSFCSLSLLVYLDSYISLCSNVIIGESSKHFYIQGNWVRFLCRDFHKLSPNSRWAIQIGKLYYKFTHLTFQWYFHLIFGRFYMVQLSHIDCRGYHEVEHIRIVSCQSW